MLFFDNGARCRFNNNTLEKGRFSGQPFIWQADSLQSTRASLKLAMLNADFYNLERVGNFRATSDAHSMRQPLASSCTVRCFQADLEDGGAQDDLVYEIFKRGMYSKAPTEGLILYLIFSSKMHK